MGSSPAAPTVGNPPGSFSADGRQHVWVAPGRASSPGQAIGVGGLELLAKPGPGVRAGRGHCRLLEVGRASTRMTRWSFFVRTPRGSSYTTSVDTKLANSRFESQNRQTPIALLSSVDREGAARGLSGIAGDAKPDRVPAPRSRKPLYRVGSRETTVSIGRHADDVGDVALRQWVLNVALSVHRADGPGEHHVGSVSAAGDANGDAQRPMGWIQD